VSCSGVVGVVGGISAGVLTTQIFPLLLCPTSRSGKGFYSPDSFPFVITHPKGVASPQNLQHKC
jgi:hypothetical protein